MIARLCGVAMDARAATRTHDPLKRAIAARWIAGNLVPTRGARRALEGSGSAGPRVFSVRAERFGDLLAVLAAAPALVDAATLPRRWRLALRALGIPVLDRPIPVALATGASVVVLSA